MHIRTCASSNKIDSSFIYFSEIFLKMSINNGINGATKPRLISVDSLEDSKYDRRSSIPRNKSYDNMGVSAEANVLVIYTGGTIGMTRNANNGKFDNLTSFFGISKYIEIIRSIFKVIRHIIQVIYSKTEMIKIK